MNPPARQPPCSAEAWQNFSGVFIALWTGDGLAYALFEEALVTTRLIDGRYPALSPRFPGAIWFERLARDLNDHFAIGGDLERTAIEQFRGADGKAPWPDLAPVAGEGVHQVAVGPIHAGITEPVHFRFWLKGEKVLKLEARLGYSHKGTLAMMRGKSPRLAARFAARLSGDSTVAHALAFAHAAEAALGVQPPPRAEALRAVMAELERIANHAGNIAGVSADAGFAYLDARFAIHREAICAAAFIAFGHRLMMDMVIPGGIAGDLDSAGGEAVLAGLAALEAELPALTRIFDGSASLQDRLVGIGTVPARLARRYAPNGVIGRACGRRTDARLNPGYRPYSALTPRIPVEAEGDVAARIRIRIAEIAESIRLIRLLLSALPDGAIAIAPQAGSGEACGVAESFRGPVWVWMQLEAGMIADIFVSDPGTLHWPLLEQVAAGGTLGDFPLVNSSINASCSGVDL